jgi:UDPglucose 6-dehydrogenase
VRHYGLNEVADYWEQVVTINTRGKRPRFVRRMIDTMFNTIAGKRIAISGVCLQKGHERHSRVGRRSIVCRALLNETGATRLYDPRVSSRAIFQRLARVTGTSIK